MSQFCFMKLDYDWPKAHQQISCAGYARLEGMLSKSECSELRSLYPEDRYRSTINMQRYRFGKGEYKYFSYPLLPIIQKLRIEVYEQLVPLANEWMQHLGIAVVYPPRHADFIARCHEQNQLRPTPLILKYGQGGYNTLHQDLYGDIYFPFQLVLSLSQHGSDYHGGELVLTEQVPRAQSKATVLVPNQGDGVIITTNFRPAQGQRGYYRASIKHGVSEIVSGERFVLGVIFHDAV